MPEEKKDTDKQSFDQNVFPFDAFTFTPPGAATQILSVISSWLLKLLGGLETTNIQIGSGTVVTKLTISNSSPSGGSDGDVWFVREA